MALAPASPSIASANHSTASHSSAATASQRKRHTLSAHLPPAPFELASAYSVNPSLRLGAGMWAQVIGGVEIATGRRVAVKLVAKASLAEKDLRMLKCERNVYESVRHPNIVECLASIEDESYFYFVLDYRGGGDLFTFVRRMGRLPLGHARLYFRQLLAGVQFLHRQNICHRDIKLENCLLDDTYGSVVVADFGLSAPTTELLTTYCGSPCYAAPELAKRVPYDGTLTDVWALGVSLFTMTAGRFPYYDDSVSVVLKKVLNEPLTFSSSHSPPLRELLEAMLTKEADKRATLEEVAKHPWLLEPATQDRPQRVPRRIPSSHAAPTNRTTA